MPEKDHAFFLHPDATVGGVERMRRKTLPEAYQWPAPPGAIAPFHDLRMFVMNESVSSSSSDRHSFSRISGYGLSHNFPPEDFHSGDAED